MSSCLTSKAIRLLAMREHSREELRRKLESEDVACEDVEAVLDRLAATGLQSDERFAEAFVRSRAARMGAMGLRRELTERGVTGEVAGAALQAALSDGEMARARAVWARKFGRVPQDRNEWARQARFLRSRGFAVDVIRSLLKEPFDESAQG